MRYTGPKNRKARREGVDLGLKTVGSKTHERLMRKINIVPGQHGTRRKAKGSDYAKQIREKQKLRIMFGLSDKQLKNYFIKASRLEGNTAYHLSEFLESRLDNVVYRLGFAPTRASARQLVNHGHVTLNAKKLTVPSAVTKVDDVVSFAKTATKDIPYIAEMLKNTSATLPSWLEKKQDNGVIIGKPSYESLEKQVNMKLIVEFYSR